MIEAKCPLAGCQKVVTGTTEEEVMQKLRMHAHKEHGIREIPENVERQIEESVKR